MKVKIMVIMAFIMLITVPVNANQYVDQFEKKLELRNKQLGIEQKRMIVGVSNVQVNQDGFISPTVGTFTSAFGWRDIGAGQEFHKGIDIANEIGTDIKASQDGQVTFSGAMGSYGNVVFIKHNINGKEYNTVYAHLSISNVIVGQNVLQGQSIAKMGSTGRSTGPHLHFEIKEENTAVDPLKYIKL